MRLCLISRKGTEPGGAGEEIAMQVNELMELKKKRKEK